MLLPDPCRTTVLTDDVRTILTAVVLRAALLTQAPMAGAGLWSTLMLPSPSGADTRGVANFMGLVVRGQLTLCAVAPLRLPLCAQTL